MKKKLILGILVISIFIFLVTVLVFVYALSINGESIPDLFQPFLQYHIPFMIVMGLFGVGSGLMAYSTLNASLEKQKKIAKTNIDIIKKFLSSEDRAIVEILINKDGMTTQSEIAKLPDMTRLKAHRIVKRLEERGIVHVEKYGKINMIRIVDELRNS